MRYSTSSCVIMTMSSRPNLWHRRRGSPLHDIVSLVAPLFCHSQVSEIPYRHTNDDAPAGFEPFPIWRLQLSAASDTTPGTKNATLQGRKLHCCQFWRPRQDSNLAHGAVGRCLLVSPQ